MIDPRRYQNLVEAVERAEREAAKAEGVRDQLQERLRNELKCENLEKAELLLEKLGEELATAEEEYAAELAKLEAEYGDKLK